MDYGTSCRSVNVTITAYCGVSSKHALTSQLKRFGGNLRRERMAQNITQEKLAELADLNIRTLQKIEAGQTNILLTTAVRLKNSLRCDLDRLV